MTKTLKTLFGAAVLVGLTASGAHASSLAVGDTISFDLNPPADETGRFGVYHTGDPGNILLWTFCLELNEYIDDSSTFYIDDISKGAIAGGIAGGNPDEISQQTAALFLESVTGTFAGVAGWGSATGVERRHSLQLLIWNLENECDGGCIPGDLGIGSAVPALVTALTTWLGTLSPTALQYAFDNVNVINIRYDNAEGNLAQSVLYTAVPEPGSLMLLGTGLLGVARAVRRRRTARA